MPPQDPPLPGWMQVSDHGVSSGNQHPFLLTSRYGKVRYHHRTRKCMPARKLQREIP